MGLDKCNIALSGIGVGSFVVASALAIAWSSPVTARDSVCVDPATGLVFSAQQVAAAAAAGNQVMCGAGATATAPGAVAIGNAAAASAEDGVAIGTNAVAAGGSSDGGATAVGYLASATGDGATALGSETVANGSGATAVGDDANARAMFSTAIGDGAETSATALGAVAIGVEATASVFGGVALGGFSAADTASGVSGYNPTTGMSSTSFSPVWRSTAGAVSVGDIGSGVTRQITDVAAGSAQTDAANVAQLQAVRSLAAAGWNAVATGAGSTIANIGPNGTVTFDGDANITVTQDGANDVGAINIALNRDLDVDSISAGDSTLTTFGLTVSDGTNSVVYGANGMTITGGPSVTVAGVDAGNLGIINVAPATLSDTSTDAVNGSQLFATNQLVSQNTANIALTTSSIDNLGQSIANGLGGTSSYDTIADVVVTQLQVGGTSYSTVNDALNAVNTVAGAGWVVAATGAGSTPANIGPNGTVTFSGDANLTVTQTGTDQAGAVNVALNRDLELDSVTVGNSALNTNGLSIAGGPSVTEAGIDAGSTTITNVAAGVSATDAVNVAQLNAATAQIAINEAAIVDANDRIANQGATIAAGLGGGSAYDSTSGIVTTELNVGGATYTSVNDAINAISATANAGWNISADGGAATNIASNGILNVTSGSNVAVTLNGNTLDVAVVNSPTFGGLVTAAGGFAVGANQTVNMGGNVIANTGAGEVSAGSTDAVNGSQLYAVGRVASNSVQYDEGRASVTFNPAGGVVRLSNVAAGVADTDAVNVAQLNAGVRDAVSRANAYTDQRVNALAFDLADTRRNLRAGVAGALAAAGLPQAFEAGKGMLAFGAGTYLGQSAFALGLSRVLDDGKTMVKAGATYNTQSEAGANVGVGFQF